LRDSLRRRAKSDGLRFASVLTATAFHPGQGEAGVADKKSMFPGRGFAPLEKLLRTNFCAGSAESAFTFAEVNFRVSPSPA